VAELSELPPRIERSARELAVGLVRHGEAK
jgi:hypothetical protein